MKHSQQIIYVSEYHLNDEELQGITLHSYTFRANFADERKNMGLCVLLHRIIYTVLLLLWTDTAMKRT